MCLDLDCTLEISCPHLLASAVDQPGIQIELYTVPGDGRTKRKCTVFSRATK